MCTVNPCNVAGVHSNSVCNPDGRDVHTCYEEYDSVNYQCLQKCECGEGYDVNTAGNACNDIDECGMPGIACYAAGSSDLLASVSKCQNLQGDYSCICEAGYQYDGDSNKMYVIPRYNT